MSDVQWFPFQEAAHHLRLSLADVVGLIIAGQIIAYRALNGGLLFNRHELDAALLPVSGEVAAAVIAQSLQPRDHMTMKDADSSAIEPDDFMPLKNAAKALGTIPYKTLLALVNRGVVPATNFGTPGNRPRWMVSLSQVKATLARQIERESALRRAPPQTINVAKFVRTGGRRA